MIGKFIIGANVFYSRLASGIVARSGAVPFAAIISGPVIEAGCGVSVYVVRGVLSAVLSL